MDAAAQVGGDKESGVLKMDFLIEMVAIIGCVAIPAWLLFSWGD